MRKITELSVDALKEQRNFKLRNTEVRNNSMYLHGHKIAWIDANDYLWITNCGYDTNTTNERLRGLPGVYIYHRNGILHLNHKPWTGSQTRICRI